MDCEGQRVKGNKERVGGEEGDKMGGIRRQAGAVGGRIGWEGANNWERMIVWVRE